MSRPTDVWAALADPDRRLVVEALRGGPATTGALERHLAEQGRAGQTRFKTLHHLKVLRESGLVDVEVRGRERWNYLNASALYQATIGWLEPQSRQHAAGLDRLKTTVENRHRSKEQVMEIRQISIKQSIEIDAPKDAVWEAITGDIGGWWGAPYMLDDESTEITVDARLGGLVAEGHGETRMAWGTITGICPGNLLEFAGAMGMGLGTYGQVSFGLAEADGGGTRVVLRHEAMGTFDAGNQEGYTHGWADLAQRLKTLVETGEKLGLSGANAARVSEPV